MEVKSVGPWIGVAVLCEDCSIEPEGISIKNVFTRFEVAEFPAKLKCALFILLYGCEQGAPLNGLIRCTSRGAVLYEKHPAMTRAIAADGVVSYTLRFGSPGHLVFGGENEFQYEFWLDGRLLASIPLTVERTRA